MKIRMIIEIVLDQSYYSDIGLSDDEKLWLENEILVGDGNLMLNSEEVGDVVGVVKSVKNIQYL